jgi:hypothetical protein
VPDLVDAEDSASRAPLLEPQGSITHELRDLDAYMRGLLHAPSFSVRDAHLQVFLIVLRLIVRPDFPALCVRFTGEKDNGVGRGSFRRRALARIAT